MNKKFVALTACVCLMLSLAACGSDADAIRYGTVVPSSGDATGAAQQLQNGMSAYASSVSKNGKVYTVSGNKKSDYKDALDKAAGDDKVKFVIAEGKEMETAIYDAQNDHHGTDFIFFDGEPREKSGKSTSIRKNTVCIRFGREDQGFLAGYTAVRAGYHTLGYISGKKTKSVSEYYDGFCEGAAYAAKEQGLSSKNVVVNYLFAGTNDLTPMRVADAENFYNGGVEIIATDSQILIPAIARAADSLQKKVAAVGFVYSGASGSVLYSSTSDYNGAAQGLLAESEKHWKGGNVKTAGLEEKAVRLSCDFSNMGSFSQSDYNAFLEQASKEDVKKSVSGKKKLITVNRVPMVAGNPKSGVDETVSGNSASVSDNASVQDAADSIAEASSVPAEAADSAAEAQS